jgi:hypothetical protein
MNKGEVEWVVDEEENKLLSFNEKVLYYWFVCVCVCIFFRDSSASVVTFAFIKFRPSSSISRALEC